MPKPLRPLKAISAAITIFIILLAFPATAIMASWKAIPGSTLYPIKRGLEKVALALLPDSFYETQFRLKLIERRTTETTALLVKTPNDMNALNELLAEAKAAQFATTSLEETQERSQAIQQLITKLNTTNQTLETIKTTSSTTNPSYESQPTTNQPSDNNQPILPPYTQPPAPQTTQEPNLPAPPTQPEPVFKSTSKPENNTFQQVTKTQEEIENIIEDLEQQTDLNLIDKCDFCGGNNKCKAHLKCFQHQGESRCIPRTQGDQEKQIKLFEKCL